MCQGVNLVWVYSHPSSQLSLAGRPHSPSCP